MTSNDIAYYKAQNERRNMRLQRKEAKRHNLASETASYMQAGASQLSAEAAAQQAATRAKEHRLQWEIEYGLPYGSDPNDLSNYNKVKIGDNYYAVPKGATPASYQVKSWDALEKESKAEYEHSSSLVKKVEAYQRATDAAQRVVNLISSALTGGRRVGEAVESLTPTANNTVPGTDLIIYGGQ